MKDDIFELGLDRENKYELEGGSLEGKYKDWQKKLHPDLVHNKSQVSVLFYYYIDALSLLFVIMFLTAIAPELLLTERKRLRSWSVRKSDWSMQDTNQAALKSNVYRKFPTFLPVCGFYLVKDSWKLRLLTLYNDVKKYRWVLLSLIDIWFRFVDEAEWQKY